MQPPENLKERCIVGSPNSPTQGISGLLEKMLTPIVSCLKTYIRNDLDFIKKLSSHIDYPSVLASCNVVSLYTSIPHDLGLEGLSYWIDRICNLIPERFTKTFISEAVSFKLSNNNFQFDIYVFLQLVGTAMSTKFVPSYACFSVCYLEETTFFTLSLPSYFTLIECKLIEEMSKRFVNECFMA